MATHHRQSVEFVLPDNWIAELDSEWGHIYYRKGDNDSALRVNVITATKSSSCASDFYQFIVDQKMKHPNSQLIYSCDKPILFYEKVFVEGGEECNGYYWETGNFTPPNCGQLATFAYTILSRHKNDSINGENIRSLCDAVKSLKFLGAKAL